MQAAGVMICADGVLKKLFAHSGHYRPTEYNILQLLHFLLGANVRLVDVEVNDLYCFEDMFNIISVLIVINLS